MSDPPPIPESQPAQQAGPVTSGQNAGGEPRADRTPPAGSGVTWFSVSPDGDWRATVEQIIGWAVDRGDRAVDDLVAYLDERTVRGRARSAHELASGWTGDPAHRAQPYRGRGQDQACSALRRRLRSQHGCLPRPLGSGRPPRRRRRQD